MKLIALSKGKFVKVDDEDFEYLDQWKWYCSKSGYAVRTVNKLTGPNKTTHMHRVVNKTKKGRDTLHLDDDTLNNQRHNLRSGTRGENLHMAGSNRNTKSKYKGVTWHKGVGKWQVQMQASYVTRYIGMFEDEDEAARAYDRAARKYFRGSYFLNFTKEGVCNA